MRFCCLPGSLRDGIPMNIESFGFSYFLMWASRCCFEERKFPRPWARVMRGESGWGGWKPMRKLSNIMIRKNTAITTNIAIHRASGLQFLSLASWVCLTGLD